MVDVIVVACVIVLSVAFATSGFRDFFFWGGERIHISSAKSAAAE